MLQKIFEILKAIFWPLITVYMQKQNGPSWVPPITDIAKDVVQNFVSTFFPAIYETQRNNKIAPGVTCAATSFSMLLQSLALAAYGWTGRLPREWEDIFLADVQKNCWAYSVEAARYTKCPYLRGLAFEKLREDFNFFVWYAYAKFGIECKVVYSGIQSLYNKVINGEIKTPWMMNSARALTTFGHVILGRGAYEDKSGKYISANDPFGTYPYGSKTNGEGVSYAISKWSTRDQLVLLVPINWPGKK